jgi:hypothetical protein
MIGTLYEALVLGAFWLFFLFCFGGGLVCIWLQYRAFRRANACRNWPETKGVIDKAAVQEIVTTDQDGTSRSYWPAIEYSYLVAGQRRTQSRIRFGAGVYSTGFRFYPRRLLGHYTVRQDVSVFYDPADPSSSVLERGRTGWEHCFMATLLFGFGGMVWFMVLRDIRS